MKELPVLQPRKENAPFDGSPMHFRSICEWLINFALDLFAFGKENIYFLGHFHWCCLALGQPELSGFPKIDELSTRPGFKFFDFRQARQVLALPGLRLDSTCGDAYLWFKGSEGSQAQSRASDEGGGSMNGGGGSGASDEGACEEGQVIKDP